MSSAPALATQDLSIGYGPLRQRNVLSSGLHLALAQGQLVCLLGPNGAGKSTLLRTLAGAHAPLHGQIRINGAAMRGLSVHALARHLALVLTDRIDAGNLNAYGVAAMGRFPYTEWSGKLSAQDETITQDAMRAARCDGLAHRIFSQLSDGERQRVMIARALAQQTPIILLDEPTAFLDLPRRIEIMQLLRALAHEQGKAILLSTHDLELALRYADRLWLMPHDGVMAEGTPAELRANGLLLHTFASEGDAVTAYLSELLS